MRKAQETADAMNAVLVRKDAKPEVFRERVAEATKRWEDSGEDPVPAWGCKWYDVSFLHSFPCGSFNLWFGGGIESHLRFGTSSWKKEWMQDKYP